MYKNVPLNAYREDLKTRILEYSRQKFSTLGIRAVKMGDIAMALGISKRTLYEIFYGKEVLLLACLDERQKEFQQRMAEFTSVKRGVIEVVVEFFRLHMKSIEDINPQFITDIQQMPNVIAYFQEKSDNRSQFTAEFLQRGVEEGVIRSDVDFSIILHLIRYMQDQRLMVELYNQYSVQQVHRNIIIFCLRGICTQKGMAQLDKLLEKIEPA